MDQNTNRVVAEAEQEAALQELIDGLVADGPSHSVEENEGRVRTALDEHGHDGMPDPWVAAVAQSLAWGNPYVVSKAAEERVEIPEPENKPKYRDIT